MTIAVDDFLEQFFGPGNSVLPGADFSHARGDYVAQFVAPLREGVRRPVFLPRQEDNGRTDAYVISWHVAQAASVRAMLEAFVAHSIVPFDGRVARLQPDDPVDAAVLGLVGANTTFVLRPASRDDQQELWRKLAVLRDLLATRPEREQPIPRPPGRVLADFNAALAGGAASTSAELLDELAILGGFSPLNLAYLRVHRLARLGRDGELLRLSELDDVIASRPPRVVGEEILAAWARYDLADVDWTVPAPKSSLNHRELPNAGRVRRLIDDLDPLEASDDALRAAAVLSFLSRDIRTGAALLATDRLPQALQQTLHDLIPVATTTPTAGVVDTADDEANPTEGAPAHPPQTWTEWGRRISENDVSWTLTDEVWAAWPPPHTEDEDLAKSLEAVGDAGAERAWSMVGPFIDADDMGRPAWQSARSLLLLAAAYDRWSPADLAGVQALLEVFTRGAPPAKDYRDTLDVIGGSTARWASVANALPALDMVDVLARSAAADTDARLRFCLQALEPINRHRLRLAPELLWLAARISQELQLDLDWTLPEEDDEAAEAHLGASVVLLYSLDAGALRRAQEGLSAVAPHARIHTSSSKVGSDQLRSYARGADAIALAIRCAKHAATGFIRQHARGAASIREADGAGSASLLRAALSAVRDYRA
ncbi:hypothetical protein SAMN06273567_106146 [Geodermatophilus aquaeductus]|uniref:Uncharacterized protein n=1 Tax=Geodermatophilus aquaeductus TaxID=1564161 RepID=A0A521EYX3_9ACTN|nr:protein DpdD [Geodermatophilus aquaeductus]SMO89109.1 hypothetical protein SAMN06273567_106146 [Geodermatophilus aquaeductus]